MAAHITEPEKPQNGLQVFRGLTVAAAAVARAVGAAHSGWPRAYNKLSHCHAESPRPGRLARSMAQGSAAAAIHTGSDVPGPARPPRPGRGRTLSLRLAALRQATVTGATEPQAAARAAPGHWQPERLGPRPS